MNSRSLLDSENFSAIRIYSLMLIWVLYLISLPFIYSSQKLLCFFYIVFPGLYLFPLFGLLIHESWHQYIPNIPNRILFPIFCFMLISDPQVYDLTHSTHHADVNSYKDMQFHPLGKIRKRYLRIIYNFFEVFLGVIFVMTVAGIRLSKDPRFKKKYSLRKFLTFLLCRMSFIIGMGVCSQIIFQVEVFDIVVPYLFTYWGGSLIIHHGMLLEHGNLIVEGDLATRNLRTRNLKPKGIMDKIICFFTHNDVLEHTLHHTSPQFNNRPFPRMFPMPSNSTYITLSGYLNVLKDMLIGIEPNDREVKNSTL
ncbi:hypothetical protein D0962_12595 [Leptolyngbyaceae cyanobacterium CCMR0082]|uniref:Fatty acid desaturase domain-containing protein n=1 Tax=Adonisia turfae CCMR0082 TaxID=2304604 RepID=A0A6M0S6K6_9CYAN|nr:fatty acid desaturase [Adonisia turfae]NEZ63611.1 hypothetical protein [Adonisia turfae CCMR0082]